MFENDMAQKDQTHAMLKDYYDNIERYQNKLKYDNWEPPYIKENDIDFNCMCVQTVFGQKEQKVSRQSERKIKANTAYKSSHFKNIMENIKNRPQEAVDPDMRVDKSKKDDRDLFLKEGMKDVVDVVRKSKPIEKKTEKSSDKIRAKIKSRRSPKK